MFHVFRPSQWKFSPSLKLILSSVAQLIAFLLLIRYVTLRPLPFTLINGHTWRVTWSTPSLKVLRLSVLELRVLISHIKYHWQCVCSHCMRRITWYALGANFLHIFEIPDPDLPIHYATFMALHPTMTFKGRLLSARRMLFKLYSGKNFYK